MDLLPNELFYYICNFLLPEHLTLLRVVCKRWTHLLSRCPYVSITLVAKNLMHAEKLSNLFPKAERLIVPAPLDLTSNLSTSSFSNLRQLDLVCDKFIYPQVLTFHFCSHLTSICLSETIICPNPLQYLAPDIWALSNLQFLDMKDMNFYKVAPVLYKMHLFPRLQHLSLPAPLRYSLYSYTS